MHKRFLIFLCLFLSGCQLSRSHHEKELELFEKQLNIDSEKRIDAAYAAIQQTCDSLMKVQVPRMVDSIMTNTLQP